MRLLLFILISFIYLPSPAVGFEGRDSAKKVLVIPYHRFEFHTQYGLNEIALINDTISSSEVYEIYQAALMKRLGQFNSNDCDFVAPLASDIRYFWKRVDYEYVKKPVSHYQAMLGRIPDKKYKEMLNAYDADYVLFINWYKIEKAVYRMNTGGGSSRKKYSRHFVDYDIYDEGKQLIIAESRKEIDGEVFSKRMVLRKKLKVEDFEYQYDNLAKDICEVLQKKIASPEE